MAVAELAEAWKKVVPSLLTVRELRDLLGCSRSTIYRWIDRGWLRRVGKIHAPEEYHFQKVILLAISNKDLRERIEAAVLEQQELGKQELYLSQRLAVAVLANLPDVMPDDGEDEQEAPNPSMLVDEFGKLLGMLCEESAARSNLLADFEQAARRAFRDPEIKDQTQDLEDVLRALHDVRAQEEALEKSLAEDSTAEPDAEPRTGHEEQDPESEEDSAPTDSEPVERCDFLDLVDDEETAAAGLNSEEDEADAFLLAGVPLDNTEEEEALLREPRFADLESDFDDEELGRFPEDDVVAELLAKAPDSVEVEAVDEFSAAAVEKSEQLEIEPQSEDVSTDEVSVLELEDDDEIVAEIEADDLAANVDNLAVEEHSAEDEPKGSEVETEVEVEVETEAETAAEEAETEDQAEEDREASPELRPEPQPAIEEAEPAESELKASEAHDTQDEPEPDSQTGSEADSQPEPEPEPETQTETETQTQPDTEEQAEADPEQDEKADAKPEPETNLEHENNAEPEADNEAAAEPEIEEPQHDAERDEEPIVVQAVTQLGERIESGLTALTEPVERMAETGTAVAEKLGALGEGDSQTREAVVEIGRQIARLADKENDKQTATASQGKSPALIASGCALLAGSWIFAVLQRGHAGPLSISLLLAANIMACLALWFGWRPAQDHRREGEPDKRPKKAKGSKQAKGKQPKDASTEPASETEDPQATPAKAPSSEISDADAPSPAA